MKRKLVLGLLMVLFVGLSAGQSLQNFEYSPDDGFERSLTGGESFNQTINFSNEADRELPMAVRVVVGAEDTEFESEEGLVGSEFDVSGSLSSGDGIRSLSFSERLSDSDLVFVGSLPEADDLLGADSDNSVELMVESSPRIRPDTFSFEFDVRSKAGFASETENTSVGESGEAEVEVETDSVTTSVDVSAEEGSNVSVESYDEVNVAPPEPDSEFVGGVGVEVTKNDNQVEASGNITVSYSQDIVEDGGLDEDSISVRYFNESLGEWTSDGVDVVSRDTEENTVTAEADHFSTYGAFAELEEQETDDDTVDGFDGPIEWSPPRGEEEEVNDSEPQDQGDGEDVQQNDSREEDDEESPGQDDTGSESGDDETTTGPQEGSDPGSPEGPTGLFTGQSSGAIGGLFVLVVVVVAYLQYSGRIRLGEMVSGLRS